MVWCFPSSGLSLLHLTCLLKSLSVTLCPCVKHNQKCALSSPAWSLCPCCPFSPSVGLLSCPLICPVSEARPCRRGHFQSSPVKVMSFFLLSLIQQLVHKKLFILPAPLPFSCAKPPQNLISGALQLQFNVSSCLPGCDYLRKFQIVYLSARNTRRGEFRLCCPRCILNQGENRFRYFTLHLPALSATVNYEAAPLS